MIKNALIFSAGEGSRMRPITYKIPKPLVKVKGKEIIKYSIDMLEYNNIPNIYFNSYYLPYKMEEFFIHNRNKYKNLNIIQENSKLETGGGLINSLKYFNNISDIITVNSDIIIDKKNESISKMISMWNNKDMDILMLLQPLNNITGFKRGYGDFSCNNNLISRPKNKLSRNYVFSGIQIISYNFIKKFKQEYFSLSKIYDDIIDNKRLYGVINNDYLFHIGDLQGLKLIDDSCYL